MLISDEHSMFTFSRFWRSNREVVATTYLKMDGATVAEKSRIAKLVLGKEVLVNRRAILLLKPARQKTVAATPKLCNK
jgi:hypothetical protein